LHYLDALLWLARSLSFSGSRRPLAFPTPARLAAGLLYSLSLHNINAQ
jgi:hypothetical protein